MQFHVQLGKHVGVKEYCLEMSLTAVVCTVLSDELHNSLVLGHTQGTVSAAYGLHMGRGFLAPPLLLLFLVHIRMKMLLGRGRDTLSLSAPLASWK